jgi:hypothetical protein
MAMSETCNPTTPPCALARRHNKAREWMIDALALATAVIAVMHYNLDGMVATLVIFVGAYIVAMVVWGFLWSISGVLFCALSGLIYLLTFGMGLDHLPGILVTLFLPVIAQAYLIWAMWPATGDLFHPLTLFCLAWLALLGIRMFEGSLLADWRPPHSNRRRSGSARR